MNAAEALLTTLREAGLDTCFANPGTTELPLLAALDTVGGIRTVLGLFEGVCTGAADGYGRMTGRPAATLLHLGPGLANGLANLHNARRARTPVVNLVGDHATWHQAADAPLASDIEGLARPMSGWVASAPDPRRTPALAAEAWVAAMRGQVATLVLPADCQWEDGAAPAPVPDVAAAERVEVPDVPLGPDAVLLLGGVGCSEAGQRAAARIAAGSGARVLVETFPARQERGGGLPDFPRLPYLPELAREQLEGASTVVLAGARSPVAFFGYPGGSSTLLPAGVHLVTLAAPGTDVCGALEELAERVGAPGSGSGLSGSGSGAASGAAAGAASGAAGRPTGPLDVSKLAAALVAVQPEGAVVVDEAATSGLVYNLTAGAAARHTVLSLTGGAIGQGLPVAVGAAVACPDRPVLALQADGSGMYTLQALWTMARESLDVTVVVCANRSYRILQVELRRAGVLAPGPAASSCTDLGGPDLDWVALATGMGVPGVRVDTGEDLVTALGRAFAEPGPHLIEALLL